MLETRNNILKAILLIVSYSCTFQISWAQELSNFWHQKPISISGSLGLRLSSYHSNSETPYYPSSSYLLTGSPTVTVYGYAIPLSLIFTNQRFSLFGQPYNQFGISPTYRNFTFNIGYHSVSYSKYALAGYLLYGLGVEWAKGNWKVATCYGRLNKMTLIGIDSSGDLPPYSYERRAISTFVRYGTNKRYIAVNVLRGIDDANSIPVNEKLKAISGLNSVNAPTPAQNLVCDLQFKLPFLLKGLSIESESAISYFTNDITTTLSADRLLSNSIPFWGVVNKLTQMNATSHCYTATNSKLNYANKQGLNVYLQYTRIDPNYQSMGLNYLQGDMQNMLAGFGASIFESKVRIGGNIGRQNNNLNSNALTKSIRWIGSGNASFSDKHFGLDLNYSNYSSGQTPTISRFADSLRITQNSSTLNCSPHYSFSTIGSSNTISLELGLNTVLDLDNSLLGNGGGEQQRMLSTETYGLSYNLMHKKKDISFNAGISYSNLDDHSGYNYRSIGANVGASKSVLSKKVKLSLNGGLYKTLQHSSNTTNHTLSLTTGYSITKNLSTSLMVLYNDAPGVSAITNLPRSTREMRSELNITYTF